jgi:hypothetical protein
VGPVKLSFLRNVTKAVGLERILWINDLNWIELAQGGDKWKAPVNTVMNLRIIIIIIIIIIPRTASVV